MHLWFCSKIIFSFKMECYCQVQAYQMFFLLTIKLHHFSYLDSTFWNLMRLHIHCDYLPAAWWDRCNKIIYGSQSADISNLEMLFQPYALYTAERVTNWMIHASWYVWFAFAGPDWSKVYKHSFDNFLCFKYCVKNWKILKFICFFFLLSLLIYYW